MLSRGNYWLCLGNCFSAQSGGFLKNFLLSIGLGHYFDALLGQRRQRLNYPRFILFGSLGFGYSYDADLRQLADIPDDIRFDASVVDGANPIARPFGTSN